MNGTPQPEMAASAGIEPGSLDHESQPLTIGPFLQFSGFGFRSQHNTCVISSDGHR